jgi:hypothetical protein
MSFNIVAIDPSLISTGLVIKSGNSIKMFNYCKESDVYVKKGMSKWYKLAEEQIKYRFVSYRKFDNYSEGELIKLKDYDLITDMIISDILENIDKSKETKIGIEGFNFGAKVGDLLDLVTFSTLLRKKLYDCISKDILVLSPSTLKLESCKLTYEPTIKEIGGKKPRKEYTWRNKIGIPGGSFTKHDMFLSIIENNNFSDKWSNLLRDLKSDILSVSKVPKPFEDINDSWILYKIIENSCL